jgi:lysozyme
MGNAIGPDVSFYQDKPDTPERIDFVKMQKSADFVIIRAGQNLWPDRDIKRNWPAAKAAGLPRGSYWFYDSRADPKRQAELWIETMGGDLGELPLFADFEDAYGGQFKGWRNGTTSWSGLSSWSARKRSPFTQPFTTGVIMPPTLLPTPKTWNISTNIPCGSPTTASPHPSVPKPWGANEWLFWQFTEVGDGELYGVESKGIDLNYFNGDVEAFRERFKLSEPPPTGGDKYRVELSIREGPGEDEDVIGTWNRMRSWKCSIQLLTPGCRSNGRMERPAGSSIPT